MFVLMILLWILLRMSAPAWCYILLAMSAAAKVLKAICEAAKEDENED